MNPGKSGHSPRTSNQQESGNNLEFQMDREMFDRCGARADGPSMTGQPIDLGAPGFLGRQQARLCLDDLTPGHLSDMSFVDDDASGIL